MILGHTSFTDKPCTQIAPQNQTTMTTLVLLCRTTLSSCHSSPYFNAKLNFQKYSLEQQCCCARWEVYYDKIARGCNRRVRCRRALQLHGFAMRVLVRVQEEVEIRPSNHEGWTDRKKTRGSGCSKHQFTGQTHSPHWCSISISLAACDRTVIPQHRSTRTSSRFHVSQTSYFYVRPASTVHRSPSLHV